jgi:hypothetical protein
VIVLALLLGAVQPCLPAHACPTHREIESAFRRWVELSMTGYVAEQSKSGNVVSVTPNIEYFEHITCSVRARNGRTVMSGRRPAIKGVIELK